LPPNDTQRATIAIEAISICRQLVERSPKLPAGHYYLGMNLGQLARTKTLGALKIVNEMEREFKTALLLDARWDYAGADRNLGLLYLQAPGWPPALATVQRPVSIWGGRPNWPRNIRRIC